MTTVEREGAVGISLPRLDAGAKVAGKTRFAGDLDKSHVLHGRPVLSTDAHARIVGIDRADALAVPGVVAVLFAADLPLDCGGLRAEEPLARDEVVFAGQPVALVVAKTEAAAADGAELVVVEYEPLPAVLDLEAALDPDAPLARLSGGSEEADFAMHGDAGVSESPTAPLPPNATGRFPFASGDVDASFASAAAVATGRFRTSWVHQGYLEPQVAVAWPDGDGGLTVHSSHQGVLYLRERLAKLFGVSVDKIRVEAPAVGGGFGAKLGLIEPLVCAGALALDRPLRVVFTRREDLASGNPAPAMLIDLTASAHKDGRLSGLRGSILVDNGAFTDSSPVALVAGRLGGVYRWEAWSVEATGVRTNRFGAGAYRAPMTPQVTFALEALLDDLAAQLELDPAELRLRNAAERGDARIDGATWPHVGIVEVISCAREHPLWERRDALPPGEGIGMAVGLFPGSRQATSAMCRLDSDGGLTVVTGFVDMTGATTSVCAIAADTFGIDYDRVRIAAGDSAVSPHSGVSGGSKTTYTLGAAVEQAAADAREQTKRVGAFELKLEPDAVELADGAVRAIADPSRSITLEAIAAKVTGFAGVHPPIEGHANTAVPELAPSAAAALVHVRVDRATGEVELLEYAAVQDVGRPINPASCAGQMRGGAAQAIGFALYEELVHDESGQLVTGSFLDYALPRSEHVPSIETIMVEVPAPYGPFGAKGIGESAMVPGAAAIASAVDAAVGLRLRELPMTPRRVWCGLRQRSAGTT